MPLIGAKVKSNAAHLQITSLKMSVKSAKKANNPSGLINKKNNIESQNITCEYKMIDSQLKIEKKYDISKNLQEFDIWEQDFSPLFNDIPKNIRGICYYGFTEMVNNAIHHSEGKNLTIWLNKLKDSISIIIYDDGVGIFSKIKQAFHLPNAKLAFLELAKGKLTTDPEHHTGQRIFFTSRIFDKFFIISKHLNFTSEIGTQEFYDHKIIEHDIDLGVGTLVGMVINLRQTRKLKQVFDSFAPPNEDYDFNKTIVPVKLAQYTEDKLISRSQAKRLIARLENFKEVTFDFEHVDFKRKPRRYGVSFNK